MNFRRWLPENLQMELRKLRDILFAVSLNNDNDKPRWLGEKSGIFTVNSVYNQMFCVERDHPNLHIWKSKIPLKIKIFIWLIQHNAILTKDNLIRKKWKGNKLCAFCNKEESIYNTSFI